MKKERRAGVRSDERLGVIGEEKEEEDVYCV